MTQLFEVTEAALRTLRSVLPAAAHGTAAVRVSARPSDTGTGTGTGTPAYGLAPADAPGAEDTVVGLDGVEVYVDPVSALLLAGVRIDHVDTPRATGFLFRPSDAQLATWVELALHTVRPQLQADGGDVELVEVRDGRAVLRFLGTCVGCGRAGLTLSRLLEQHLRTAVPGLEGVTAETVPAASDSAPSRDSAPSTTEHAGQT